MARLAGGGAIISDTCNTARKTRRLLTEMIRAQAIEMIGLDIYEAMTDNEKERVTRVHEFDCVNHLRNIILNAMSDAMSAHVAEELKLHLEAFSSWERLTTDFTQLLRATYKEFHHGCRYYKGKGREFTDWINKNHSTAFVIHFERAEGGRQDLDYDAAVPLYVNRQFIVEFLYSLVFTADHSNILEDFLYITLTAMEYIAVGPNVRRPTKTTRRPVGRHRRSRCG